MTVSRVANRAILRLAIPALATLAIDPLLTLIDTVFVARVGVVELAALLDVPIGVIRVLVVDLRRKGAVTVTDPPAEALDGAVGRIDLLTRVLDGIKAL